MSSWYTLQPVFCEGNAYGPPEYLNSYSSLVIIMFGLYGLWYNTLSCSTLRLCYSMCIVCGIGSFGFHYTLQRGWCYMDQIPMLLIQMMETGHLFHTIYPRACVILLPLYLCFNILTVVISTLPETKRTDFANLFTLQFIPTIICMLWARFISHKHLKFIPATKGTIFNSEGRVYSMMWQAFSVWIIAGCIWNIYERTCGTYSWLRYIPIHPMWHILSSYGTVLFLQTGACIIHTKYKLTGMYLPMLHQDIENVK